MTRRPAALLYCQHSLGLGHLVRTLAVAAGLTEYFRVVVLCGGPVPRSLDAPPGVEIVALPALRAGEDGRLVPVDGRRRLDRTIERRRAMILAKLADVDPAVIVVELFPFGRKKFRPEIVPLLEAAHARRPRPVVACSLRDILVHQRADQAEYDERASVAANEWFDAVLVHGDPAVANLADTFTPRTPLRVPVHYTGFVVPWSGPPAGTAPVRDHIVVSAGGGAVGGSLLEAAARAHRDPAIASVPMTLVTGPFLADALRLKLSSLAGTDGLLHVRRFVPNLGGALRTARASVSQCGYNTAIDVLAAGVPALFVPYGEGGEDEQRTRARRLSDLGACRWLAPEELSSERLASELVALLAFEPRRISIDLDGARASASILARLALRDERVRKESEVARPR